MRVVNLDQMGHEAAQGVRYLVANAAAIAEAKQLLKWAKEAEDSIKKYFHEDCQQGESIRIQSQGRPLVDLNTRANGAMRWLTNFRLLWALVSSTSAKARDAVFEHFALEFTSRNGASERVRDDLNLMVAGFQADGFAGAARVTDPEPVFVPDENGKRFATSLTIL